MKGYYKEVMPTIKHADFPAPGWGEKTTIHIKVDLQEGSLSAILCKDDPHSSNKILRLFYNLPKDTNFYPAISLYGSGIEVEILKHSNYFKQCEEEALLTAIVDDK